MRALIVGVITVALLGTLAAYAVMMGWGGGGRPVAATLIYAFDPPAGDEAAVKAQLVETLKRRGGRDARVQPLEGNRVEVEILGEDSSNVTRVGRRLSRLGTIEFRILANRRDHSAQLLDAAMAKFPESGSQSVEWIPIRDPKSLGLEGEIAIDPAEKSALTVVPDDGLQITGAFLTKVEGTTDATGSPALAFELNGDGAARMRELTRRNLPLPDGFHRRLAILIDGRIATAPNLRAEIGEAGVIAGKFTKGEVDELVRVLRAGALPIPIRQVVSSESGP